MLKHEKLVELILYNTLSPQETALLISYLDIRTKHELLKDLESEIKKESFKKLKELM